VGFQSRQDSQSLVEKFDPDIFNDETGGDMENPEEDLVKLLKKVDRLEKKMDLIIEHLKINLPQETSESPSFITGITQYDMEEKSMRNSE